MDDRLQLLRRGGIFFGWNAVHEIKTVHATTTISLEDTLELIAYRG